MGSHLRNLRDVINVTTSRNTRHTAARTNVPLAVAWQHSNSVGSSELDFRGSHP